jgi:hypothetical protein
VAILGAVATLDPEYLDSDLASSPSTYPGLIAPHSGLLMENKFPILTAVSSRRIGQSHVKIGPNEEGGRCTELPLNYVLLRNNVSSVDARFLVVAIGSNASPGVMRRKFEAHGESRILPMLAGTLQGFGVGHSCHVSAKGYIAAAPYRDPDMELRVVAALLDQGQLNCLDATEPNYERRTCTGGLTLESGEQPKLFYVYDSRWGLLTPPGRSALPLTSQADLIGVLSTECPELLDVVARRSSLARDQLTDVSELLPALAGDSALRDEIRELLRTLGWSQGSGLQDLPAGESPKPYGRTSATWPANALSPTHALDCGATRDALERDGQHCVVLNPRDIAQFHINQHAFVLPALNPSRPGALARVVVDASQTIGSIGVDQIIRNSLGVELGERVVIGPAQPPQSRIADVLIARPHYVMCRVQSADLATVEQPVCLLAPLAMSILGVESGGEVIVEGTPGLGKRVRTIRLRAHALPDDVEQRRETLAGGRLTARFPSALDALAVYPDLPWVFLDSAARTNLGIVEKLGTVRIRASRRYQWSAEIRELLLLLVIAFIGLASLIRSVAVLFVALISISVITLLLVRTRLRLRLHSKVRSRDRPDDES